MSKRGSIILDKINAHRLSRSTVDAEHGDVEMASLSRSTTEAGENLGEDQRNIQLDTEETEELLEDDSLDHLGFEDAEKVTVSNSIVNSIVWNTGQIELAKRQIKSYLVRLETAGEYRVTFNKLDIVQTRLISYRLTIYQRNSTIALQSWRGEVGGLKNKINNARFTIKSPSDIHISFKSHSITGLFNVKCSLQLKFLRELADVEAEANAYLNSPASPVHVPSSAPIPVSSGRDMTAPPNSPQSLREDKGISSPPNCVSKRPTVSFPNIPKKPSPSSAPILDSDSNPSLPNQDLDSSGESLDLEASSSLPVPDDDPDQIRPVNKERLTDQQVIVDKVVTVNGRKMVYKEGLQSGYYYIGIRNNEVRKLSFSVKLVRPDGIIIFDTSSQLTKADLPWKHYFFINSAQAPAKLIITFRNSPGFKAARVSIKLCEMEETKQLQFVMEKTKNIQMIAVVILAILLFGSYFAQFVNFIFSLELPLVKISLRAIFTVVAGIGIYYYREELYETFRVKTTAIRDRLAFMKKLDEQETGLDKLKVLSERSRKKKEQRELQREAEREL